MQQHLQNNQRINPCAQIVNHDAGAFRQFFQAPHRRRLHNIERSKKYKAGKQRLPPNGTRDVRHQLPGNFIDDDMRRIVPAATALLQRRRGNADGDRKHDEHKNYGQARRERKM